MNSNWSARCRWAACVYALFALGFTLVFGVLGVINLSHGAVFMVGATYAHRY